MDFSWSFGGFIVGFVSAVALFVALFFGVIVGMKSTNPKNNNQQ